jgi:hypothetical protein
VLFPKNCKRIEASYTFCTTLAYHPPGGFPPFFALFGITHPGDASTFHPYILGVGSDYGFSLKETNAIGAHLQYRYAIYLLKCIIPRVVSHNRVFHSQSSKPHPIFIFLWNFDSFRATLLFGSSANLTTDTRGVRISTRSIRSILNPPPLADSAARYSHHFLVQGYQ